MPITAQWVWDGGDRWGYQRYLCFRRRFSLDRCDVAGEANARPTLQITADAYYLARLNGRVVGHGPIKSVRGMRFVDTYDLAGRLAEGLNTLEVTVMSMGAGSVTYAAEPAGLWFDVSAGRCRVVSDTATEGRPDPHRRQPTVRRWMQPAVEDVDAAGDECRWSPAVVVASPVELPARRVPLPSRSAVGVERVVRVDTVRLPEFCASVRLRPALAQPDERSACELYDAPAYIVTDLHSPIDQDLRLVPTLGAIAWYHRGRNVCEGHSWTYSWDGEVAGRTIRLDKGPNRLIGVHRLNHIEDATLAGFCDEPITVSNPFGEGCFGILPVERTVEGAELDALDLERIAADAPPTESALSWMGGNPHALAMNAEPVATDRQAPLLSAPAGAPIELPAAPAGQAVRAIIDLGELTSGHLAFDVEGAEGSRLIFSMFEGLVESPFRIHWPEVCRNSVAYRCGAGLASFESMHHYGGRYIAIHHTGPAPVRLRRLRILSANCGSRRQGHFVSDDLAWNGIHQAAVRTVIAGVDDTFTDCPLFEQANWNFDNRAAFLGEVQAVANLAVARHSIALFAEDPDTRGLVSMTSPTAWQAMSIPLWSLHWILWVRDYYEHTGDKAFARSMLPRIVDGLDEALGRLDDRGLLNWPGGMMEGTWHFLEWGTGRDDDHAVNTAEQGGLYAALHAGADLAGLMGQRRARLAERYRRAADTLRRRVNARLWDADRGAYADSLHDDGTLSPVSSQATNAAMAAFGLAGRRRAVALADRILAGELLPIGSPYGLFYILEMLDGLGRSEDIFNLFVPKYRLMLEAGDTTLWEHFQEFGEAFGSGQWPTRSRCHPISAYVLKYYTRYLLGIERRAAGYRRVRIRPRPPEGMNRAEGSVPTPHGRIHVSWQRRGRRIRTQVDVPDAITVDRASR